MIASTATTALPIAPDAVDPHSVPKRTLYTGAKIPVLGLGTFGSDRFTGEQIAEAVLGAASYAVNPFCRFAKEVLMQLRLMAQVMLYHK